MSHEGMKYYQRNVNKLKLIMTKISWGKYLF